MKTINKICVLASVVSVLTAPNVFASIQLTLQDTPYNTHFTTGGLGGGGEFSAHVTGANFINNYSDLAKYNGGFSTFCLEYNEIIGYGGTYNVAVSSGAVDGGVRGGNPDPISKGTSYLYEQFGKGTLAGYNYADATARQASSLMLQQAIWYLEGEIPNTLDGAGYALYNPAGNSFLDAVSGKFGSLLNAEANANGGNVVVLNITDANGNRVQDQLAIAIVPETSTVLAGVLLLLPLGASTLRIVRKNRTA